MGVTVPLFIVIGCKVGIMTYQWYKNRNILARSNIVLSIIRATNKNDDSNDDDSKSAVTATTMVSDKTLSISIPSGKDDINNDTSDDELYLSSV